MSRSEANLRFRGYCNGIITGIEQNTGGPLWALALNIW